MDLYKKLKQGTYLIAEMSANHGGSKTIAKEIIRAAKEAGADGIKLQTYTPDTMTLPCTHPPFFISQGTWKGSTLYQLYQKAYTPWEWQAELKEEAEKIGIDFFSTPFDSSSVDFLEQLGVECYKIASFELVDLPLIEYVASKGKPVFLSTGMGTFSEIQEAVTLLEHYQTPYLLFKCSSGYPAPLEEMNLATIPDLKEKFGCPVGLSDHTMGHLSAVAAVCLGAQAIEKHFCLSRNLSSPDASFSMEPHEFAEMVQQVRKTEQLLGTVQYGPASKERENLCFRRSIFVTKDVKKGEPFTKENLRVIRPGHGLAPKYYPSLLGRLAAVDLCRGTPMKHSYVAGEETQPKKLPCKSPSSLTK